MTKVNNHDIYDKRLNKPIVYRVLDINEDITLKLIGDIKIGKARLKFDIPNFTALFLSKAKKELEESKEIFNKLIKSKLSIRETFELSEAETLILFDYFEHIQTAITLSFMSVECLANHLIPDDYIYIDDRNKSYDKKDIERWISTTDKLIIILPKALNISNPKNYDFWPKFTKLKDLRNDVVHFVNTYPIQKKENERLLALLLNDNVFGKIQSAFDLIKKIHKQLPPNDHFPILNKIEPIEPKVVDSWKSLNFSKTD